MVIALTGFMGSGKTTVGQILADLLGCDFVDLDEQIVRKAGCSIPEIFARDGEEGFRKLESQALGRAIRRGGGTTLVLSLGGGTLTRGENVRLITENTLCIYLRADVPTLAGRLQGHSARRPLLDDTESDGTEERSTLEERIAALLALRVPVYESTAHLVLDTDGATPEEIADEIIISCL